jgi:hypothetical protein
MWFGCPLAISMRGAHALACEGFIQQPFHSANAFFILVRCPAESVQRWGLHEHAAISWTRHTEPTGATLQLPEALADRLLSLVSEEGVIEWTAAAEAHLITTLLPRKRLNFPLTPKEETGVISRVSGADLDEMFTRDYLAS